MTTFVTTVIAIPVALILAHAMVVVVAAAPSGFKHCPHNGRCYKGVHVTEGISWNTARVEAEKVDVEIRF